MVKNLNFSLKSKFSDFVIHSTIFFSYKLFSVNNESFYELCKHNSEIAVKVGDLELSKAWGMIGSLTTDDIIASVRASLGYQFRPSPLEEESDDDTLSLSDNGLLKHCKK